MANSLIRHDFFIDKLDRIYTKVYIFIFFSWIIFIMYLISRDKHLSNPIIQKMDAFFHFIYQTLGGKGVVLLGALPFYAPLLFPLLIRVFALIRKWIYPKSKFTKSDTAIILKKEEYSTFHGDGNVEHFHYLVELKNPLKANSIMKLGVNNVDYYKIQEGDRIKLRTIPNGPWIILLEY